MSGKFTKTEKQYQDSRSYTFRELESALASMHIEYKKLVAENVELKQDLRKYDKIFMQEGE